MGVAPNGPSASGRPGTRARLTPIAAMSPTPQDQPKPSDQPNDSVPPNNSGEPPPQGDLVAFGRFRFDASTGELWRDGHTVRLAPKPAQVLGLLVRSSGRLLSRSEIEREVWGDVPIDLDRSVNFAIRQIRSALGDSADSPTYIETLPKRGYRFIAPITHGNQSRDSTEDPEADEQHLGSAAGGRGRPVSGRLLGAVAVLALVAIGVASGTRASLAAPEIEDRPMLAVLPFSPLGDASDLDYFASGLGDELITRLARLDPVRLGVIARTSAGRAATESQTESQIAGALGASYLLSGSITPEGEAVRIHVRLVTPSDGAVVWSQRYVESIPTSVGLEFDIAARVADALREQLMPGLAEAPAATTEQRSPARDAYMRGAYLLRQGRSRSVDAVAALTAAVAADSSYAPARAALGRALLLVDGGVDAGRSHLSRAIELDPELADPHITLAMDALYREWDQATADDHFREALRLDPGSVLSHHPYAYHLSIAGRHSEAIHEMETALRLDPVSPLVNGDVGRIYYRAGRFEEALAQCQRTLDLVPDDATALSCLINIHMLRDQPELALPFAQMSVDSSMDALHRPNLDSDHPAVAMQAFFAWKLEGLRKAAESGFDVDVPMAQAALWLGRTDEALDHLESALRTRSSILPQVPGDPCFALLAGNARYEALLAAMGIRGA